MIYVFDTSSLSTLFKNYYPSNFRTLWDYFDELVGNEELVSTREVRREIENCPVERLRDWAKENGEVFATPTADEGAFLLEIFSVPHFQQVIERKKLYKGGKNADPFVVAKAAVDNGTVVTQETLKPNGSGIPNICDHFDVPCMDLEGFMKAEEWEF